MLARAFSKRYERNPYSEVQGLAWTWGVVGGLGLVFVNLGSGLFFLKMGREGVRETIRLGPDLETLKKKS